MGLLTKVIVTIATKVIAEMEANKAEKAVRLECYNFCKARGIPFIEVIHTHPADFMAKVDSIGRDKVKVVLHHYPVEYTAQGLKSSMMWSSTGKVLTVNTNYIFGK